MKRLVLCAMLFIVVCLQAQVRTIRLDARNNALLLTSNNAKMVGDLTPNQAYTVSVTANSVTSPMQGAFFMVQDPSEVQCRYVPSGGSFQFVPINNTYQLAAFYVDWSATGDNSGTVTVNITGPTTEMLTIDAKDNAILLDNATTIVGNLDSTIEYVVNVRDSAMSGYAMRGAYFMYQEASGVFQFKYIPPGQAFTFKPSSLVSYQLAPLYVDWSTTADNAGTTIIDIAGPLITGVVLDRETIASNFVLEQNYPNPFNPSTEIGYRVQGSGYVTLKVYDLLGREVAVLVNERKAPGSYSVRFDASGLASGVYLYRLQGGSFVQTKKLLLLR